MRLIRLAIKNYRSIKCISSFRVEPFQALVGENNAGKSNILRALECFLSIGAGTMQPTDFNDPSAPAIIEAEFGSLSATERRRFRPYIISNRLILHKNLSIEVDRRSSKQRVVAEYHGYRSEPRDEWLSIAKLQEKHGTRPKWEEIAIQHGILEYVLGQNGKADKGSYEVGIGSILLQRDDIAYDEPRLGQTQALGLQPKLLASLPQLYLLPAITDYSDEIDRRSSSTVFRRLMADLSDRIMRSDPRYAEIERARVQLRKLLNRPSGDEASERLAALEDMESALRDTIKRLMPSIEGVHLSVEVEETKDIFAKGVDINGRRRRAPIRPGCRRERDGMTP